MSKYVKPRLMTPEEARQECQAMSLSNVLTDYIVRQFEENQDAPEPSGSSTFGPYVADDGKIGWAASWETIAEELAEAMGKPREAGLYGDDHEFEIIWDKFFTE